MIYALWHGGSSYSVPEYSDAEVFTSERAARDEFWARAHDGEASRTFPDGTTETVGTPCVYAEGPDAGGPTMHLYGADPRDDRDPYPYAEITFGPRGGVRQSPC